MAGIAKIMIMAGLTLAALGAVLWGVSALFPQLKLGRLPGDIAIERDGFSMYIPITTMLIVSAGVTIAFWLISAVRR